MRAIPAVFSTVLVSAGALAFAVGSGGTDPADPPPPPANTAFAGVMLRVGLGADTLAAASITSAQVPALVQAVEGAHSAATVQSRDDAYVAARQTHDRLRRLVQSGKGTQSDVASLRAAEESLTNATSARENHLASLRTAALGTLSAGQVALVERIRANRTWGLPVQYLVKDRTEPEWVALRDALAAKRIAEEDPEESFPQSARDYLAAADAVSEVATAKVNLDSNIAAVQTAWNTAASH